MTAKGHTTDMMRGVLLVLLCLVVLVVTACGGGGSGTGTTPPPSTTTFSVDYPARSRAFATAPSSALSGPMIFYGANPLGGNLSVPFNRNSTVAAHTETYTVPSIKNGTFKATLWLYSQANQGGVLVGTATANDTVSSSGHTFGAVSLTHKVASVATTPPPPVTIGGPAVQLEAAAKDANGAIVPVSPGSFVFVGTGTAASVTADGKVSATAIGSIQVTVAVDGVTSVPITIQTTPALGPTGTYHAYDLPTDASWGTLNDNGDLLGGVGSGVNHVFKVRSFATGNIITSIPNNVSGIGIANDGRVFGNVPVDRPPYFYPSFVFDPTLTTKTQLADTGTTYQGIYHITMGGLGLGGPDVWENTAGPPRRLTATGLNAI
ncbi:MAG: hypothetical protein ABUL72_06665, partial [Armatimonadota bacterium]